MPLNFSISRLIFRLITLAVFGAVIHICIILTMPYVSKGDAWGRLETTSKINELAILPDASSPNRPFAFMAPDVLYATCRYDLTDGPLQLRSPLPNDLWSIALYNRYGENYYLISGRDVQSNAVNLLVVNDKTIDNDKQEEQNISQSGTNAQRDITISAPSKTCIIVIRAPLPTPAFNDEVSAQLAKAYCKPISFAQQALVDRK